MQARSFVERAGSDFCRKSRMGSYQDRRAAWFRAARSDRWREGGSFVQARSFVERAGADTSVGITVIMLSASKIDLSLE